MEIEKKRETSWNIFLNNKINKITLTSVEVSGEVRDIRIALKSEKEELEIEMNKQEFFNFLSLISAFKDVVIGDSLDVNIKYQIVQEDNKNIDLSEMNNHSKKDDNMDRELDPKEWDPW
ncbi:MAG: hypothetical protein EU518_01425 [Promethearchaeota archaeon]|nr:MAG: hypothetical protein EU518_01425 [Candidatus Lokiarchaeota archaeon]